MSLSRQEYSSGSCPDYNSGSQDGGTLARQKQLFNRGFKSILRHKHRISIGAGIILGLIFVVAGLGKLLHQPDTVRIFFIPLPDFLTQAVAKAVFNWLPRIELAIGLLLIAGIATKLVAIFSLVLIAGFITHNSLLIINRLGGEPCDCLGKLVNIPITELSVTGALVIDVVMLALILLILFWGQRTFFDVHPWFLAGDRIAKKKD